MKGHAKIELTNVKTGEVQVIEEDNIVTNLLRDLHQIKCLQLLDTFAHTIDSTLTNYDSENANRPHTPYTEYGGLIMFREQLEADPDKYYPEEEVTMTAHASDDAYTGVDLTRGSFNTNLSSYSTKEGSVTLVWDFNMEQGNGTIGTVCLCNHVDGKIGYGSMYSPESTNNAKAPFYHHTARRYNPHYSPVAVNHTHYFSLESSYTRIGEVPYFVPVFLDYANNQLVFMATGIVDNSYLFVRADIDGTSIAPISYKQYGNSSYDQSRFHRDYLTIRDEMLIPVNVVVKTLTSASSDSYRPTDCCCQYSQRVKTMAGLDFQGNFWFANDAVINEGLGYEYSQSASYQRPKSDYAWNWRAGSEMIFNKLNLSTMETTEYKVTNTTGADIIRNGGYWSEYDFLSDLCVVNDYMFIRDGSKLYAINLNNNSDVKQVMLADGTPLKLYSTVADTDPYTHGNCPSYTPKAKNCGWALNVLGNTLIVNVSGGYNSGTEGYMYAVRTTDFTARRLSAVQLPRFSVRNNTGDRNRGDTYAFPVDRNLVLGVSYTQGSNWTSTSRYMTLEATDLYHAYNPMGLITINTLAEPVTKTADMTMRITYTLTT